MMKPDENCKNSVDISCVLYYIYTVFLLINLIGKHLEDKCKAGQGNPKPF